MAEALGITAPTASEIRRGLVRPSPPVMERIHEVYGIPLIELHAAWEHDTVDRVLERVIGPIPDPTMRERNEQLRADRRAGMSWHALAVKYGVSRARVREIVERDRAAA
jgi:transcriptional regulator with XRE-family HTH domain